MDPAQESASSYYNKYRKRSFFYSRLTVLASMLVLVITLGINISLLTSHDKSTITSHAAEPVNPEKILPSLPVGCAYQQTTNGFVVVCPTPTATATASAVPINVALPQLPPQCSLETSTGGNQIHCTALVPIPTVAITLPTTCEISNKINTVMCDNNTVAVTLPSLPAGCSYSLVADKYNVVCAAR